MVQSSSYGFAVICKADVLKQYDLHLTYALGGLCFARIFLLLINMVVVPQGCFSAACISEPAQPVLVDLNLNCGLTCTTCESRLRNGMTHVTPRD